MENLPQLKRKAKSLRIGYLHCTDAKQATILLRRRSNTMDKVHNLHADIANLYQADLKEENVLIEGLLIEDLTEMLFNTGGFKNRDFLAKFPANNGIYKKIGDFLEEKFIIVRGQNNARELNTSISLSQCLDILLDYSSSKKPYFNYTM